MTGKTEKNGGSEKRPHPPWYPMNQPRVTPSGTVVFSSCVCVCVIFYLIGVFSVLFDRLPLARALSWALLNGAPCDQAND